MDILLSLPMIPYLLSGPVSSWSTSLNLLFFYMTWTTLVLSHPPLRIQLFGLAAVRIGLWLVPSVLFLAFDTALPSLSRSLKVPPAGHTRATAASLPPRDAKALAKTVLLALFNLVLLTVLEGGASLLLSLFAAGGAPVFKTASTLPLPWGMARQLAMLLACREVVEYYVHRYLLHYPGDGSAASSSSSRGSRWSAKGSATSRWSYVPRQLTALHASYAHSRPSSPPFSLALLADHPLCVVARVWLPLFAPAALLPMRPHLLTYFLFVALATGEETMTHSGYSVVPGIILGGMSRRCAAHYSTGGRGNFGAWGLLDWAHGTGVGGGQDVVEDVKDEAEKHRLKERGEEQASEGLGFLQDGMDAVRSASGARSRPRRTRKARAA